MEHPLKCPHTPIYQACVRQTQKVARKKGKIILNHFESIALHTK